MMVIKLLRMVRIQDVIKILAMAGAFATIAHDGVMTPFDGMYRKYFYYSYQTKDAAARRGLL